MVRTRVRWRRVAAAGALATLAVGLATRAAAAGNGGGTPAPPPRVYVVRAGDTLWSIAQRATGAEADPRALVDAIAARNHVDGPLTLGEHLVLPAG